jgi:hypothetical protein
VEAEGDVAVVVVDRGRRNVGVDDGKAFGFRHARSGVARIFQSVGLTTCRESL